VVELGDVFWVLGSARALTTAEKQRNASYSS
jgi:hypothetical protein